MVLSLKTWKSRSLPVLPRTFASPLYDDLSRRRPAVADEKTAARDGGRFVCGAALRKQVGRRGVASAAAFYFHCFRSTFRTGRFAHVRKRRNALAECLRLFGEQPVGQARRTAQMRRAARCNHGGEA